MALGPLRPAATGKVLVISPRSDAVAQRPHPPGRQWLCRRQEDSVDTFTVLCARVMAMTNTTTTNWRRLEAAVDYAIDHQATPDEALAFGLYAITVHTNATIPTAYRAWAR